MKYSIKKSHHSYVMFTHENGVKAYRSTPVELEFWKRIQELEKYIAELENTDEIQSTAIAKYQEKLDELEGEIAHWKSNHDNQVKLKAQLMDRPDLQDRAASIQKLQERISDLEAWNEMLTETGHWIGQDEAHDLKVAVKKFLDMTRLGRILDEETTIWEVPCWQMDELSKALRDSKFNSPPNDQ